MYLSNEYLEDLDQIIPDIVLEAQISHFLFVSIRHSISAALKSIKLASFHLEIAAISAVRVVDTGLEKPQLRRLE